jgi:hypothetical protein
MIVVVVSDRLEARIEPGPLDLLFGKFDKLVEVPKITLLKEPIGKHRRQGGCDRHRDPERDPLPGEAVKHIDEGDVGLGDRLEEPPFLEEILMFRVPDKGKVSVEDEK